MSEVNVTRLPSFNGTRKDFQTWWVRFIALANISKFVGALKAGGETTMPTSDDESIDESIDAGKAQAAAKHRNALAMANFTMAF